MSLEHQELLELIDKAVDEKWEELDLSSRDLPVVIAGLTNLTELNLNGNQIDRIPSEIYNLTKLKDLGLRWNKIIEISSDIGNLTNLIDLDFGGNHIK